VLDVASVVRPFGEFVATDASAAVTGNR